MAELNSVDRTVIDSTFRIAKMMRDHLYDDNIKRAEASLEKAKKDKQNAEIELEEARKYFAGRGFDAEKLWDKEMSRTW